MYVVLLQTFNDLMEFLRSILKIWITNIYPLTINLTYIFWAISKIRYFQEGSCDIFLKFQDLKVFVFDNVWTQHVSDIFSVAKQFISFFVAILSKCLDDHHYTRKHEKEIYKCESLIDSSCPYLLCFELLVNFFMSMHEWTVISCHWIIVFDNCMVPFD